MRTCIRDPRPMLRECRALLAIFAILLAAVQAHAQAAFNVSGTVNGANVVIGTLAPTIDNTNQFEKSIFQLNNANKFLMNDAMMCQFRYFQFFNTFPSGPTWKNGVAPVGPFTDPPSGGYDYQQANGGADTSPFYENDDGGGPYAFPRYSDKYGPDVAFPAVGGTPVHSQAAGNTNLEDAPNTPNGVTWEAETYITFVDKTLMMNKMFIVLAGYKWTVGRPAPGNALTLTYTGQAGAIGAADLMRFNTALTNAGFAGWTAKAAGELNTCPEPGAYALLIAGGGVFFLAGKRRIRRAA